MKHIKRENKLILIKQYISDSVDNIVFLFSKTRLI